MEVVPIGIAKKRQFLSFLLILLSKSSKNGKIGRLSVIPVGTTSIVIVGHFFGDPKGLNKFRWSRTKIRGTLYWELGVPNHPKNRWKWAKNDKNGSKSKFLRCPIFKFFVVIREVIPEKMAPISDSINFFWVLSLLSHCDMGAKSECNWLPYLRSEEGSHKGSCWVDICTCPRQIPPTLFLLIANTASEIM